MEYISLLKSKAESSTLGLGGTALLATGVLLLVWKLLPQKQKAIMAKKPTSIPPIPPNVISVSGAKKFFQTKGLPC